MKRFLGTSFLLASILSPVAAEVFTESMEIVINSLSSIFGFMAAGILLFVSTKRIEPKFKVSFTFIGVGVLLIAIGMAAEVLGDSGFISQFWEDILFSGLLVLGMFSFLTSSYMFPDKFSKGKKRTKRS